MRTDMKNSVCVGKIGREKNFTNREYVFVYESVKYRTYIVYVLTKYVCIHSHFPRASESENSNGVIVKNSICFVDVINSTGV